VTVRDGWSSVAFVALASLRLRLGFPLPILSKRTTNIVGFLESAGLIA
jgi:hypothetical protein